MALRQHKSLIAGFAVALAAVPLAGCMGGSGRPATVEIQIVTTDFLAKRFVLGVGASESKGLTADGDAFAIKVEDNWTQGTKLPLYVETSYVPDKDPILNSMVGNWSVGELTLTGSNWNLPLILHIGEATIWSDEGSWAQVSKSPTSEKYDSLTDLKSKSTALIREVRSFETKFKDIQNQQYTALSPGLCSQNYGSVNSAGEYSVWATECWAEYETLHIPEWNQITAQTTANTPVSLRNSIQEVSESLEGLSRDFRMNDFITSQAALDRAAIEFRVSSKRLLTALSSVLRELTARDMSLGQSLKQLRSELDTKSISTP